MRPLTGRLLVLLTILGLFPGLELWSQCQKTGPYTVEAGDRFEFTIAIDSIALDDLSDPLQGLCAVSLEYEHQSVSNMQIELESPAGQRITLVGPIGISDLTFFTQWNISFLPCAAAVEPDLNFDDTYSNLFSWGVLGEANGSYYPFSGCLEDFDTGPVTGEWKVIVRDQGLFYNGEIHSVTLFFCDPTGLECLECAVPENTFTTDSLVVCTESLPYTPNLDTAANFDTSFHLNTFLFLEGDSIVSFAPQFSPDSLPFGSYEVCLWTLEQADSTAFFGLLDSISHPDSLFNEVLEFEICAVKGDCAALEWVDNSDTLFLDSILCSGEFWIFRGDTLAETGTYIFQDSISACPQIIQVDLTIREPMAQLTPLDTITCLQDTVVANASSSMTADSTRFRWEDTSGQFLGREPTYTFSAAGEYQLIVSDGICTDSLNFSIFADVAPPTFSIFGDTTITCLRDSAILFLDSVDSGTSYFWLVQQDTLIQDSIVVSNADTVRFIAEGVNGCIDSQIVVLTEDLRAPEFTIDTQVILCPGDTVLLSVIADTAETYTFEWSGPDGFSSSMRDTLTDQAGTYILQATHPETGCQRSDTFDLEASPLPNLPEIESDTLNCLQRRVQLKLDTVVPGWNYLWVDPFGDTLRVEEPEVDVAGAYVLWVSDPQACSDSLIYEVPETLNFPRYEIQGDTLGCTDSMAIISVDFLTDSTGFLGSWEDPLGRVFDTTQLSARLPGQYIFRLTNGDFCETRDTFLLIEDFTPFAHLLSADTINCFSSTAQVSISGGTDDFDYLWSGPDGFSASGDTLDVDRSGPYTVAISSLNCFYERGIRVAIDTLASIPEFDLLPVNCTQDTGRIVFPEIQLIQVERFDLDSNAFIEISGFQYSYISEQSVSFRVTGKNGCLADTLVVLPVDTLVPSVSLTLDSFTCDRRSVQAVWSSSEGPTDVRWIQNGLLVGQSDSLLTPDTDPIQLELQFQNTCRFDTTVVPPVDTLAPDLQLSPQNLNCTRQAYDLTALPEGDWRTIQWVAPDSDTLDNIFTIPIDQAGTYFWQLTGTNGCIRDSQFTVQQDTMPPDFTISNTVIPCDQSTLELRPVGDSSTLSAFQWQQSTGTAIDGYRPTLPPGDYVFIYEGLNTCVDSLPVTVVQDEVQATVENLQDQYILNCDRTRDTLRPQINGIIDRFFWVRSDGTLSVGEEIEIVDPGRYQLIIQERDICFDTLQIDVELDTLSPSISLSVDTLTCNQPEVQAEVNIQASDPRFEWTGPDGFSSTERAPLFQRPGNYALTVTDANGCFSVDSLVVPADLERPSFEVADTFFVNCDRPVVRVGISIDPDQAVAWWDDAQVVSTDTAFEYPPGANLIVTVAGTNGCVAIDSVYLSATPKSPSTEWDLPVLACDNLIDTIRFVDADGDYRYQWSGPANFDFEGEQPAVRMPGTYVVSYTNANACETQDTLSVTASSQPPQFQVLSNDTLRCLDSIATYEIDLNEMGDFLFQWSALSGGIRSGADQSSAILQGPGRFAIKVQDRDSFCIARDTVDLQFADPREWPLDYESYDQFCIEDTLRGIGVQGLDSLSNGPFTYLLEGDTVTAQALSNLQPGSYNLSVFDGQGCAQDTRFEVVDRSEEQTVNIGEDGDVSLGQDLSLLAALEIPNDEIASWVWIVNTQDSCFQCIPFEWVIRGPTRIDYFVQTLGGCILTDQINLLPPIEELVFVPNIFSPNDDGVNDFFYIQTASAELTLIDEIQIFNRSGNLIFERRDFPPNVLDVGWNGMFRGKKQDPQVFTVLLKYTFDGKQRVEVYPLTLVR